MFENVQMLEHFSHVGQYIYTQETGKIGSIMVLKEKKNYRKMYIPYFELECDLTNWKLRQRNSSEMMFTIYFLRVIGKFRHGPVHGGGSYHGHGAIKQKITTFWRKTFPNVFLHA